MYEIVYDYRSEKGLAELYEGDLKELLVYLQMMARGGCYNIIVTPIVTPID